jgi:hypothetical protein
MRKHLFVLAALALSAIALHAQPKSVPLLLNYQGYLAVAADTLPYTGTVNMTFSLFAASSGGSALWTETQSGVAITKGFFNAQLGGVTPLPPALFDGTVRYLEFAANGQTFSPRKPLVSVGYSIKSLKADTAGYAASAGSAPVGAHNHIGQRWSVNPGSLGLSLRVDAASAAQVYGYVDTVYNTGTGATYGMALNTYGNSTGIKRGIYSIVDNGGSGAAWAGNFETNNSSFGTGERIGVRAFAGRPYDGGTLYGVHSTCWPGTAHNGEAYGGYFNVDGGSSSSIKYGLYATATGSGTNYAGYFAGDLTTTGKLNFASTYVPANSAATGGSVGDISYDASYVYIKTASGWRRAALSSW